MKVTWCSHFKRSRAAANRRLGRRKMLAKQANTREAWRICTRFACTGRGGAPTPRILSCFFKSRENVPDRERLSGFAAGKAAKRQEFNLDCTILQLRYADSRFAKPRKFPKGNGFTFFSLLRKEPKVAQRVATLWTPGTVQNSTEYFFRDISAFRP